MSSSLETASSWWNQYRTSSEDIHQWSWHQHEPGSWSAISWPWSTICRGSGPCHGSWSEHYVPGLPQPWVWTSWRTLHHSEGQPGRPQTHAPSNRQMQFLQKSVKNDLSYWGYKSSYKWNLLCKTRKIWIKAIKLKFPNTMLTSVVCLHLGRFEFIKFGLFLLSWLFLKWNIIKEFV